MLIYCVFCCWLPFRAIIIDFDVGSYFDPVNLHRSMVGTDGYMVSHEKNANRLCAQIDLPDAMAHNDHTFFYCAFFSFV